MNTIEPIAGFPPIVPIQNNKINNNKVKKRSFDQNTIINIDEILQKKRSTPFISMSSRNRRKDTITDDDANIQDVDLDGGYLSQSSIAWEQTE
jgi:hypothetical protein